MFALTGNIQSQSIYKLDQNHTKVGFSITHFGISHVEGRFKNFAITLVSKKEDFTDAVIEMKAEVKSINTDIDMRDEDLKSEKWFDSEKYPTLSFKSTSFKKLSGNKYKLDGNITIHGITKPISLDVIYNGKAPNPMTSKSSVGFTIIGKLNRNDFSVGQAGGVVGDEVELVSNVEFIIN